MPNANKLFFSGHDKCSPELVFSVTPNGLLAPVNTQDPTMMGQDLRSCNRFGGQDTKKNRQGLLSLT
ncbi:MAG: hypothetical protein VB912_09130, partial [Pirellulaceae bacterium]